MCPDRWCDVEGAVSDGEHLTHFRGQVVGQMTVDVSVHPGTHRSAVGSPCTYGRGGHLKGIGTRDDPV